MENNPKEAMNINPESLLLTRAEFDAHLKAHMDHVDHLLKEPTASLIPTLAVISRAWPELALETSLLVLAVPFDEHVDKRDIMMAVGARFHADKKIPVAIFLATEAWASERPPGKPHVKPRHDPDRREVVICCGTDMAFRHQAAVSRPIRRNAENKMVAGPWEIQEDVTINILEDFFRGFALALGARGEGLPS